MEKFVEQAEKNDLNNIVALKMAMFRDCGNADNLAESAATLILCDYQKMYENNSAIHFVSKVDGKIVAIAGAFIKSDIPYRYFKNPEYGFIGDVYTLPTYRGQGLASILIAQTLEWFRSKNISEVRLLAAPKAESIYKQLGFKSNDEMVLNLTTYEELNRQPNS